jgi:hypothetical protein
MTYFREDFTMSPVRPPTPLFEDSTDNEIWKRYSMLVQKQRIGRYPAALNETLLTHRPRGGDSPLAALFASWAADNLKREFRFEEAASLLAALGTDFRGVRFAGRPLGPHLAKQLALCQRSLGHVVGGVETLRRLAEEHAGEVDVPSLYLRAGTWAEAEPELRSLALECYRGGAAAEALTSEERGPARRALERLENGRRTRFAASPQLLARDLARALRGKDAKTLVDLASPTHFSVGIGTHRSFLDAQRVLTHLAGALKGSNLRFDPYSLRVHGDKAWLRVEGWQDPKIHGGVTFLLTSSPQGWQFGGILLELPFGDLLDLPALPPIEPPAFLNSIRLKAPWPSGECFEAGGLAKFIYDQTAILGALAPCLAVIAAPLACAVGLLVALALEEAYSLRPCGFGPRGFYYDFNTHKERDRFAIDFTRYQRGVPYLNRSAGTPVLAAAEGFVTLIEEDFSSGSESGANRVHVRHTLEGSEGSFETTFESESLHLAGPNSVPVSPGMFVLQGARLGEMDDTGFSALSHLHFSLHDDDQGGDSVPPSPLDGHVLGENGSGTCICSTNVPLP